MFRFKKVLWSSFLVDMSSLTYSYASFDLTENLVELFLPFHVACLWSLPFLSLESKVLCEVPASQIPDRTQNTSSTYSQILQVIWVFHLLSPLLMLILVMVDEWGTTLKPVPHSTTPSLMLSSTWGLVGPLGKGKTLRNFFSIYVFFIIRPTLHSLTLVSLWQLLK